MSSKIARATLLGATTLAAALALTGCTLLGGGSADRDDEGPVTETTSDSVFNVSVGDCLQEPDGTEISDVELVPCAEEHDYEIFHESELPDGEFPTDLDAQAEQICIDAFESFIGVPYAESSLEYSYFVPTSGSWSDGDHLVQCIVLDPAGPTTGSLAGANK